MTEKNGSREKQDGRAGNVLIVDDNPANLHLLSKLLTKKGYKVRPATSGALALTSIQSVLPDVILLDIKMPKMDGYEVCRRLKADQETCHVPVLFISALSDVADKVRGLKIGAVDYITKPFQQEEVLARVNTHVTLSRITKYLEQKVAERTLELTKTIEQLATEIVERKQTEAEKNRFLEAVRQSGDSIVITDKGGTIQFVNPAFEMITDAVEVELQQLLSQYASLKNGQGCQQVVRNGCLPEREIQTGIGPVTVRMPKIHDKSG